MAPPCRRPATVYVRSLQGCSALVNGALTALVSSGSHDHRSPLGRTRWPVGAPSASLDAACCSSPRWTRDSGPRRGHLLGVNDDALGSPVQLRLGFPQPDAAAVVGLTLRGLTVVAVPWSGTVEDVCGHLTPLGVRLRVEPDRGVLFPVADLRLLAQLSDRVRLESLGPIGPLLRLAIRPTESEPATVTRQGKRLLLTWFDGADRSEVTLDEEAIAALVHSELPFVATDDAWSRLREHSGAPLLLGKAQLNHDGFVEIVSTKPQQLETAPLRGLFRLDGTHFGLSAAYLQDLDRVDGIEWVGRPVRTEAVPQVPASIDSLLSSHLRADLRVFVERLTLLRGQAIAYPSGLGRRILSVAALEVLDAFPALVVVPPWALWVWQRNLEIFGKTSSLRANDSDVRLITYRDLALRPRLDAFSAIVFDDLSGPDARSSAARSALRGLGAIDAYRLGICEQWPEDPEEACALLEVIRPGEFDLDDVPLARRYPLRPVERAEQHAAAYLLRRSERPEAPVAGHRRSEVWVVQPTSEQVRALEASNGPHRLASALDVVAAGPPGGLSPKLGAALQAVSVAAAQRCSIAVVTRSARAAALLRATLAAFSPTVVDGAALDAAGPVSVVLWSQSLGDLRRFSTVVFLDYPWSTAAVDAAVGSSAADTGPANVVLVHAAGTIDDRLAVYAARRRELGSGDDPNRPPTREDVEHLLARRWSS